MPSGGGNYNPNPAPRGGNGPFGAVPGPVGLPNPSGDLSAAYPNLSGTNSAVSGDILAGLNGQLSPGTLRQLQDYNAQYATASGMPGTNAISGTLANNRGARDLGSFTENLKNKAIDQYNATIPTVSRTQTVTPELQTQIADRNSVYGAAPDPTQAQNYARQLFNQYYQGLRNPAGGTGNYSGGGGAGIPAGGSGNRGDSNPADALNQPNRFAGYPPNPSTPPGQAPSSLNAVWDDYFGAYVNPTTGAVVDQPGGTPWDETRYNIWDAANPQTNQGVGDFNYDPYSEDMAYA